MTQAIVQAALEWARVKRKWQEAKRPDAVTVCQMMDAQEALLRLCAEHDAGREGDAK